VWSPACEETIGLLKEAFTSTPILHQYDSSLPPIVETDASDYAIAGIFCVRTNDNDVHIHPVAFFSRTLPGAKLNYDTGLLAIFEASKPGDIILTPLPILLTSSLTTRTWNISQLRRYS
jgi:hypothetical protein